MEIAGQGLFLKHKISCAAPFFCAQTYRAEERDPPRPRICPCLCLSGFGRLWTFRMLLPCRGWRIRIQIRTHVRVLLSTLPFWFAGKLFKTMLSDRALLLTRLLLLQLERDGKRSCLGEAVRAVFDSTQDISATVYILVVQIDCGAFNSSAASWSFIEALEDGVPGWERDTHRWALGTRKEPNVCTLI